MIHRFISWVAARLFDIVAPLPPNDDDH